jgi:acetolactate synthase-1/2/3 large subunit
METITGGQLAAESLIERGVEYIFTISGGHITPIYQYLEGSSVRLFDTRHEQAAVFMAEAWGRMTRRPGTAMVTAGPGFTNALSGIANARMANSPLVLISGCVGLESAEKLDLQGICQLPVISPMVKNAFVCYNPERIPEFVDLAYRTAASGRPGPVYLELPIDVLNEEGDLEKIKRIRTDVNSRPVDLDKVHEMMGMIEQTERPIIIAGSGTWYSDAGADLVRFVEHTGIPTFTSSMGRGTISDMHPLCYESSLPIRPGAALLTAMTADLIIFLGARMGLFSIFGEIFDKGAKIVQVDIEPEEIGRNRSVDLAVVSDIKAFLRECNRVVGRKETGNRLKKKFGEWDATVGKAREDGRAQAAPDWESNTVPIHPMRLAQEVNNFMDRDDDIVVADGGDTQIWMGMTRIVKKAGRYLDSGLYGCLAVGIPYANAAQLLNPGKRVCLVIGDGSVGFNFMEFEVAIRRELPIVVVINNDLGWGMIKHSQELRIGHSIKEGTHIGRVDYHRLVEALGGKGMYIERPEEIRPALEEAFSSGLTTCINVMTDPSVVSPGSVALASLGAYKAE